MGQEPWMQDTGPATRRGGRGVSDTVLVAWSWVFLFATPLLWFGMFLGTDMLSENGALMPGPPGIYVLEAVASVLVVAPLVACTTLSLLAFLVRHRVLTLLPALVVVLMPTRELLLHARDVWPIVVYGVVLQVVVLVMVVVRRRRASARRRERAAAGRRAVGPGERRPLVPH